MLFSTECNAATLSAVKELKTKLFQNYSTDFRPLTEQNEAIKVNVTLQMMLLEDFDDVNNVVKIASLVYLTWVDQMLVWDPVDYNITRFKLPTDQIWLPHLISSTVEDVKFIKNTYNRVTIDHKGTVTWIPIAISTFGCLVDVSNYPFDSHQCTFHLNPYGYQNDNIKLILANDQMISPYAGQNREWEIISGKGFTYHEGMQTSLVWTLHIKRRHEYVLVTIIIPITLLVVLSPFVFLMPINSGERVSYSITVLLAFSVYMTVVSENMPKTSLPVSTLSYFMLNVMFGGTMSVIINIIQLRIYNRPDTLPIPTWLSKFTKCLQLLCLKTQRRKDLKGFPNKQQPNDDTCNCNVESLYNVTLGKPGPAEDTDLAQNEDSTRENSLTWTRIALSLDVFYFILSSICALCAIGGFLANISSH